MYLINSWRSIGYLFRIAKGSPGFVVSVALYGALALIDQWMGQPVVSANLWPEVQELVALYRENIADISGADIISLHILDLDVALHDRVRQYYNDALQRSLVERIENADQVSMHFGETVSDSFLTAFRELAEVLIDLGIDFVPIQGTLIALLRYGVFPAGRLSEGKEDVVDNDAEVMILLANEGDLDSAGARLSLALEAKGWPPCTNPHARKFVCLSMRHAIPCKLEIYAFTRDFNERVIFASRTCSATGHCEYLNTFPFQYWRGRMPLDLIYPMKKCRIGSLRFRTPCPNLPLHFLSGWNQGEYKRQSFVPMIHGVGESHDDGIVADGAAAVIARDTTGESNKLARTCLALPVVSKDRDMGDKRNQQLDREGLTMLDLYLLHSYAKALHARGFASFYDHLYDPPCVRRQWRIYYGEPRYELSRISKTS